MYNTKTEKQKSTKKRGTMKLFLKRKGCNPCKRVKEALDFELLEKAASILYLDEISKEDLDAVKRQWNLKTVPTLIVEAPETKMIADSNKIIELLTPLYGLK